MRTKDLDYNMYTVGVVNASVDLQCSMYVCVLAEGGGGLVGGGGSGRGGVGEGVW